MESKFAPKNSFEEQKFYKFFFWNFRRGPLRRTSLPPSLARAAPSTLLPPRPNSTWPPTWDKPPDPKLLALADTTGVPWTARLFHKLWLKWHVCLLSKLKTGFNLSSKHFLVTISIYFPSSASVYSNTIYTTNPVALIPASVYQWLR